LFFPLIAAGMDSVFCLETKGTNAEAPSKNKYWFNPLANFQMNHFIATLLCM
jgi:hypothetical protein